MERQQAVDSVKPAPRIASLHEPSCAACGPRGDGPFCRLAPSHLALLGRQKTVHAYRAGQIIYSEGEPAEALLCLHSGAAKLYKASPSDDEQVIRMLGPGDLLGCHALFSGEPYATSAEAMEPSTLCAIPKAAVFAVLAASPDACIGLLALLARELRTSEEQMFVRTRESVRQRTARVLLWLAERRPGRPEGMLGTIELRRKEIAALVATTPESLSRCLRTLTDRALLSLTRTEIRILDAEGLRRQIWKPDLEHDLERARLGQLI